jgi:very-short-patch-repair endonuclease
MLKLKNMTKKYTTMEFKKKYSEKWGKHQYDLSKINYTKAHNVIEVRCILHEFSFFISAYSFLGGKGCVRCAGNQKITPDIFKKKSEIIHGPSKYDYDNIKEIKNNKTKVPIKCLMDGHGIFWQTPNDHLRKHGCPKCAKVKKLSWKEILDRFYKIHGSCYDYSLNVENDIKNIRTKIKIVCPNHGVFEQTIDGHLNKQGCLQCHKDRYWLSFNDFIKKSNKIHNHSYDYSKIKKQWKNTYTNIEIVCSKHGSFWQLPKNHLRGRGCPVCGCAKTRISKGQREVYEITRKMFEKTNIVVEYLIDKKYADICFPDQKIIIEYYGDYWHANPKIYKPDYFHKSYKINAEDVWERDQKRKHELENLGYKVFVIWEHDFKNNKKETVSKLNRVLKKQFEIKS